MTDLSAAKAVRSLYRQELFPFVQRAFLELRPGTPFHGGLHVRAICYALERVERGDVRRLLILMPPRHLKSFCASEPPRVYRRVKHSKDEPYDEETIHPHLSG